MKKTREIVQELTIAQMGAVAWIFGTIQFFVCQLIVGSAWSTPYSWSLNNVSDLGNIYCQPWGDNARYVCSPLHNLMNASFIEHGILIIAGVIMIRSLWGPGCLSRIVRSLLVVAGLAILVAGLVPADVNENVHVVLGAWPLTFLGNIGLILTGPTSSASLPRGIRVLGPVIGTVGLIAAVLFSSSHYLGLSMGGMERLAGFNSQIWTLIMGCYLLVNPKVLESATSAST